MCSYTREFKLTRQDKWDALEKIYTLMTDIPQERRTQIENELKEWIDKLE